MTGREHVVATTDRSIGNILLFRFGRSRDRMHAHTFSASSSSRMIISLRFSLH